MNISIDEILKIVLLAIAGELIVQLSRRIFKKYKIIERKLLLPIFFLLLFGLLFIILPIVYLIIYSQQRILSPLLVFFYLLSIAIGLLLLIIMVWLVVRRKEPVQLNILVSNPYEGTAIGVTEKKSNKLMNFAQNLLYIVLGFLLYAACVYLFIATAP